MPWVLACDRPVGRAETTNREPATTTLVNEDWQIVEMATAHGAFTIEVEAPRDANTAAIARELIEPLQQQHAEVLVCFYERDGEKALPMSRVQWTVADGYQEITY